jgi:hypothetical protein
MSVALDTGEQEFAFVGTAEAGFEELHERQPAEEEFESGDVHRVSGSVLLQYTRLA